MKTQLKRGLCGMCRSQCAIQATITDGKITKIEADTKSPYGRICTRGALAPAVIYGKDRLLHPLIRTGKKGEGKFRQASFDEAFDYAASLIKDVVDTTGAPSIATYFGQGVLEQMISKAGNIFSKELGTPNKSSCGSICNIVSKQIGPVLTFGIDGAASMKQDIEHCDAIFVWGKNTDTDDGTDFFSKRIQKARQRGAKLVVIDPRKEGIGQEADIWVPIMPGSDGALALAMLKRIIDNHQYNEEIVANYTSGFDKLKEYLDTLTTTKLLRQCNIEYSLFEEITNLFVSTNKIPLISYTGLEYQLSAVQNIRAIYLLWALTDKIDVKGGIYFDTQNVSNWKPTLTAFEKEPIGKETYPLFTDFTNESQFACMPKAILEENPYPIEGLLICGGSPIVTYPDSQKWKEAYQKLKCFIVLERYMTEDAKYADVIFPACTWYENASANFHSRDGRLRYPLIEPLGECKNDVFILQGIASRLGFGDCLPKNNEELYLWAVNGDKDLLEKLSDGNLVSLKKKPETIYHKFKKGLLRSDKKPGFPTPSGKIEIISQILVDAGYDGLPIYKDIRSLPQMDEKTYPLILTSGSRGKVRISSFGQNIPEIAKYEPYPALEICKSDAKKYEIKDNEKVRVISPFGNKCFTAKISDMAPGSIHIPFGGGSSFMEESWANGNVNDLCSLDYTDPISGFVTLKCVPCRLEHL